MKQSKYVVFALLAAVGVYAGVRHALVKAPRYVDDNPPVVEADTTVMADYAKPVGRPRMGTVYIVGPNDIVEGLGLFYVDIYSDDMPPFTGSPSNLEFVDDTQITRIQERPLGDVNGDCSVNVLDLIFVRNRLEQDPTTRNNRRGDVNEDGFINILDLIAAHNELGAKCGE